MSATTRSGEDIVYPCVTECYFREHMAERELLFHDTVPTLLAAYDKKGDRV